MLNFNLFLNQKFNNFETNPFAINKGAQGLTLDKRKSKYKCQQFKSKVACHYLHGCACKEKTYKVKKLIQTFK